MLNDTKLTLIYNVDEDKYIFGSHEMPLTY